MNEMEEKRMEEQIREEVSKFLEIRDEEAKLRDTFKILKEQFEEENKELILKINELREKRVIKEENLKQQRCLHYEITKNKSNLHGLGMRIMKKIYYPKDKAMEWALEHKLALKLDEPTFKKIAVAEKIEFVEVIEEPIATIGAELKR